jgi:transposase InsO family protein
MDDERVLKKALLRYQIISPFLAADPPRGQRYKLIEQLASRQWVLEEGSLVSPQPETIRYWLRLYRVGGFEALKDKPRRDAGQPRGLTAQIIAEACRLKQQVPERSIGRVIKILETTGKAPPGMIARSTLHRALKARGLSARKLQAPGDKDLDRFQADYANDLWQADMLTGPWLPDPQRPGKNRRAHLYAFLDDASRLVPYGRFFFKGDLPALELVMKRSIQRFGCPRRAYYDNGMVFRSRKMAQICATLGMHRIVFTTPYRPMGHGKIEAFNRACRAQFIAELKASPICTLEELNRAFLAWLELEYNKSRHSELGVSPHERWMQDVGRARYVDEENLRKAFLFRVDRTADKTGVFKLHGGRYQVGWELAKKKFQVLYDPEQLEQIEVFLDGKFIQKARPLEIRTHRAPRKIPRPSPVPEPAEHPPTDYLGHLVKRYQRTLSTSATTDNRDEDGDADAFVALVKQHLADSVFDEPVLRSFYETYGPLDLARAEQTLSDLLEVHPDNHHIHFYLDAIRKGGLPV